MKRYSMRIEFDGNYYNIEKVPSSHGSWVDADIAQEIYDVLREAYFWGNLPMPLKDRIQKVIEKADKD